MRWVQWAAVEWAHIDTVKSGKTTVHPIHGIWPIIGILGVLIARPYFATMPREFLICPSKKFLGIRCPGCGSGTALLALSEFRLMDAVIANPLFVVGGFLLCIWGAIAAIGHFIGKPLPDLSLIHI